MEELASYSVIMIFFLQHFIEIEGKIDYFKQEEEWEHFCFFNDNFDIENVIRNALPPFLFLFCTFQINVFHFK